MYSNNYFSYDPSPYGDERPPWQRIVILILIAILFSITVFAQESSIKTSKASYWEYNEGHNKLLREGYFDNEFTYNKSTQILKVKIGKDSFESCVRVVSPEIESGRIILYTEDYVMYLYDTKVFLVFNYDKEHFFLFKN